MILLRDVPLQAQLDLMRLNICQEPGPSGLAAICDGHPLATVSGLMAFRTWLARVYGDAGYLEGKDDHARFNGMVDALTLLYACLAFGELDYQAVVIDKAVLLQQYKKGSLAQRARLLGVHGLVVEGLASSGDKVPFGKASRLAVSFPENGDLIPALKAFVDSINSIEDTGDTERPYYVFSFESIYNKLGVFLKADFGAAFTRTKLTRDSLDPRRTDIQATVGQHRQAWSHLVGILVDELGLQCSGFFNYLSAPSWGVSFYRKGQRPLLIFTMAHNLVTVELTLPVDTGERIIRQRQRYSPTIQRGIESFGCVQCPKQCGLENIIDVDGISFCTGRAEARRIYMTVATPEDWDSLEAIAEAR